MIISNVKQGSEEWLSEKAGKPSTSDFSCIITSTGKQSTQREKYLNQLAAERITGKRDEGFTSKAMERGIEVEAEAVLFYEGVYDMKTEVAGVCYKNEEKSCLASPDRLVYDKLGSIVGLLEIKCPLNYTHVKYLLDGKLPTAYFQQVQGQLYVTGLEWCDFMSYYAGLKPLVVRVKRDVGFIARLDFELQMFNTDLNRIVKKIAA